MGKKEGILKLSTTTTKKNQQQKIDGKLFLVILHVG